jgi:hypothetical protein
VYGAFLTLVSLLCVPIILWLDPWKWAWPQLLFLVRGGGWPRRGGVRKRGQTGAEAFVSNEDGVRHQQQQWSCGCLQAYREVEILPLHALFTSPTAFLTVCPHPPACNPQVSGNTAAVTFIWFAGLLFWPYFLAQTGLGYFRVYAMAQGLRGSEKAKGWKVRGCNRGAGAKVWSVVLCVPL